MGLTSLGPDRADAARLSALVQGHFGIENRLHWVRDVIYDEDRSQIRTGSAPRAMARVHNLAISRLRLAQQVNIARALRRLSRKASLALTMLGLQPSPSRPSLRYWPPRGRLSPAPRRKPAALRPHHYPSSQVNCRSQPPNLP